MRRLCAAILERGLGEVADLAAFEQTQSALIAALAHLKTEVMAHSARHDALTGLLQSHGRVGEPVFRFGGEELLVPLQAAGRDEAGAATERLLQALRATPLRLVDGSLVALRASAGLAAVGRQESMASAIEGADRALCAVKASGRDRWVWDDQALHPAEPD